MILRPRQRKFVDAFKGALKKHGNTVAVGATGFGKTIVMGALTGELFDEFKFKRGFTLAHRQELVDQNATKSLKVRPDIPTGIFDASNKTFTSKSTHAMVQSLVNALEHAPTPDFILVDEGHHIAAPTYRKVLDHFRELNPDLLVGAVTATPERGDRKGLSEAGITNCCDVVTAAELIKEGLLVRPVTYVVNSADQDALARAKKSSGGFDDSVVADILSTEVVVDSIIRHWKDKAGDRQTVVFCSTVEHSKEMVEKFRAAGVTAEHVDGAMNKKERAAVLKRLDRGETQVVCNVMVLTEGFDSQPVSCVVLLRQSSAKSTYIQMIGRGLRTVDQALHPGIIKTDCVVLDFGLSTKIHGSLEVDVQLHTPPPGDAPTKDCPECGFTVPASVMECPDCRYKFPPREGQVVTLENYELTEVDILSASPFQYVDVAGDGSCLMSSGFEAHVFVGEANGLWYAAGGTKKMFPKFLGAGDKAHALVAADKFMSEAEPDKSAGKKRRWLKQGATDKQREILGLMAWDEPHLSKYDAHCRVTWKWTRSKYQAVLFPVIEEHQAKMAKEAA
jgi:superfamily II DNA or RNA helicase